MNRLTVEQEHQHLLESLVDCLMGDIAQVGVMSTHAKGATDLMCDLAGDECGAEGKVADCLTVAIRDPAKAGEMLQQFAMDCAKKYVVEHSADLKEQFQLGEAA